MNRFASLALAAAISLAGGQSVLAQRDPMNTASRLGSLPGNDPTQYLPPAQGNPADSSSLGLPRTDENSRLAHADLVHKARKGGIDLYFLGDSITRRWGTSDAAYADFLAHWQANFFGWNAGNFGWGGDTTRNILWRIQNGELDRVSPRVIVLLARTNDVGNRPGDAAKVDEVTRGIEAILNVCRRKAPNAKIVLTAIFPRNDDPANPTGTWPTIRAINANLARMADGKRVIFLDVNNRLAAPDGTLAEGVTVDGLHLSLKGYGIWADGLTPILRRILGPRASTDHAPPPTGDPSAKSG